MSVAYNTLKGASWLSLFKLLSQIISWTATIIVTRLLSSNDYGLMEMATIFTGYISFFVEFGIGSGIINKDSISKKELSSTFWALTIWGMALASLCLILAPITATFYSEPELYNLTQAVGILFIISSLIIVPRSILHRELRFKEVGIIEICSVIVSCIVMIISALNNAGPWTLLFGHISREIISLCLFFLRSKFIPTFHISLLELSPLIRFGTPVVLSTSLYYIYTKADRFFGGRTFGAEELGYYAVGLQLAAIPVEKIVSILQSVLFPALSKLKNKKDDFNKVYLSFVEILAIITFPLFIGGILIANELVILVLGEKWSPAIIPLQLLLAAQLVMALSAPNSLIHAARGVPKWNLLFNLILTPFLVLGFYLSANQNDLYKLAIPWISIYPLFQFCYIYITNKELGISLKKYLSHLINPIIGCLMIFIFIILVQYLWVNSKEDYIYLLICILGSAFLYVLFFFTFGKSSINRIIEFKNSNI